MHNNPWRKLGTDDALRVNSGGRFNFFWVVIEDSVPGLMLKIPSQPIPLPKLPKLKNIVVNFRRVSGGWAFVLGLKEPSQIDIFETLCRDVVAAGESAVDLDDALSRSIHRTRRWHHLLRQGNTQGLSVEEQRGLVGELAFLRELAHELGVETAIEAWTGPSGAPKDFEFIGCCVEVKTRRSAAKPNISISSAEQLSDVDGVRLFLNVFNVESAITPSGKTLHDYVSITAKLFENSGNAFNSWEEAIYSTGYDLNNEYDERRWVLGSSTKYEVVNGFPRIACPLPSGVVNVQYSISLDGCAPFESKCDIINLIQEGFIK